MHRPPALHTLRSFGLEPDPWQLEVLDGDHSRLLLNCCRQAGKSTVVALLALVETVFEPNMRVLLVSRSARQSAELLRRVVDFHRRLGAPLLQRRTATELELSNFSRVISLPCREDTIRGYDKVDLLIIDEAARVPDDLYRAVRPMLAVCNGRLICLSTPFGKRGFFYDAWNQGGPEWHRIAIAAPDVPRISAEFLADERRNLGETFYRQEYECAFESLEGLVYPDFSRCVTGIADCRLEIADWKMGNLQSEICNLKSRKVGGIDFGFRNPFAAVWGHLDSAGILWLTGEHYARQKPLSYHATRLPRDVSWYCDPAGATERAELRCAGFKVHKGINALWPGIAAVSARVESGRLHILEGRCPNLLREADLYRYGAANADGPELPVDEHNHALAALRYLIMAIDQRRLGQPEGTPWSKPKPARRDLEWFRLDNPAIWTTITFS